MKKIFTLISAIIFSANVFSQPSIQWQKCLGGTLDEFANFIHQTSDGGYIVSGHTQSNNGDVTGNHGNRDFWLVQLDSTGNLQWQKCLGGTYDDGPSYARQTADGGYIVAGTAFSDDGDVIGNHGIYDFWLLKTDANGNLQ